MIGLGFLPGGFYDGSANGVSADGSIVVGFTTSSFDSYTLVPQAFRWSSSAGMQGLGDLPGGFFHSVANDVSGDGTVIVGSSFSSSGKEAFRWTEKTGMVGLGDLPGGDFESEALGVSKDGSVIVGYGATSSNFRPGIGTAFIWDELNGMRDLQTVLEKDFGLADSLAGWQLLNATDVSDDGKTIVGFGFNFNNNSVEAWVAQLISPIQPLPEPNTLLLFGIGLIGLIASQIYKQINLLETHVISQISSHPYLSFAKRGTHRKV